VNIDWSSVMTLQAPDSSTLLLNTDIGGGRIYRLNPKRSIGRRAIRSTVTPKPQGHGSILHRRWADGSELQLAIQLWDGTEIACNDVLVDMYDDLRGHLWKYLSPEEYDADGGRAIWTPEGKAARMVDAAKLLSLADPDEDAETGATELVVILDTPFPYAIAHAEAVTNVNGAGTVSNNGNVDFWPVIKMNGDGGDITNNTTGKVISIDAGCLGGGSYIEIDTFRKTAYVDGDQANAKPCVDVLQTEFFALRPGANSITTTVSSDFLVNDAWA
jgi:hypothetical protein